MGSFNPFSGKLGYTLMLTDGKPGIYYYDGKFLVFPYSMAQLSYSKGDIRVSTRIAICQIENGISNSDEKHLLFQTVCDQNIMKFKIGSNFIRSIISEVKYYKDWNSLCSYIYSMRLRVPV